MHDTRVMMMILVEVLLSSESDHLMYLSLPQFDQ